MTTDLNNLQVDNTVDARGSACPGPLLEAKKGIGKVKVGQVLEIYSNDSGTRKDILEWLTNEDPKIKGDAEKKLKDAISEFAKTFA